MTTPTRCTIIRADGLQCESHAGHDGPHTAPVARARRETCPVCGGPMPEQEQARRVSYGGVVTCDNATCEARADG